MLTKGNKKQLSQKEKEQLLKTLAHRFQKNMIRHVGVEWPDVQKKLEKSPAKLWSLNEMERTGGEPDLIACDKKSDEYAFFDCSQESPKGRRSLCYDEDALRSRKEHRPAGSAVAMANEMGVELITEDDFMELQKYGDFDTKSSSWLKTPSEIRKSGGAIFGDNRYGRVFIYHNGAESYYAARGFRVCLRV